MNREQTIVALIPMVEETARHVAGARGIPWRHYEDLRSDGFLGTIKAVDNHKADLGTLEPYARRRIHGEILDGIRSRTGARTVNGELVRTAPEPLSLDVEREGGYDTVDPSDDLGVVVDRIAIGQVLDAIPQDLRKILVDHFWRGADIKTLAAERQTTRWHANRQLERALSAFRRLWGR